MKKSLMMSLSAIILMSISAATMADTESKKVTRSDRISFQAPMKKEAPKVKRMQRTDRAVWNMPQMEQPSLQQKRMIRSDRIAFTTVEHRQ